MAAAAMPELGESLDPWTEDDPENFDLDGFAAEFYGDASERRMRHLRDQLSSLRDLAESEQRQNVFAHYESFIRVSREISMLQGQVGTLREMVKVPAEVVSTLLADARGSNQNDAEGAHDADDEASATLRRADERAAASARAVTSGGVDGTLGTLGGTRGTRRDDHIGEDGVSLGDAKRAAKLADDLDEALSGREVFAALETIEEGTKLLDEMRTRAAAVGRQTRRGGDETTSKAGTAVSERDATRVKRSIDADAPTRTGSPSLGETRANPLFAAMQRTTTPTTTPPGIATSGTFDEKEGPATNDESEPGPIQQLALALADARAAALAALMDTLVDPHETKARRLAARDSLRRAGASASAARHVANAELAAARAATERLAKNERGVAFAVEACEAIFSALRVMCSERDERDDSPHGSVEGGGDDSSSDDDVFIAERVREETSRLWDLVADRCLGRWSTATSLPEACASVLVCVCHVDAFVADVGGTSVKQQHATCAVDVLRTHPGVNAGMKRVLDAATEAFVSDESDDLGGSSGNWIDAGERWLETTAWDDLRALCERGIAD